MKIGSHILTFDHPISDELNAQVDKEYLASRAFPGAEPGSMWMSSFSLDKAFPDLRLYNQEREAVRFMATTLAHSILPGFDIRVGDPGLGLSHKGLNWGVWAYIDQPPRSSRARSPQPLVPVEVAR